jgi:hypothetical protein
MAQVLRGHTGIVIAGREALLDRLTSVRSKLEGTRFKFSEANDHVEAMCPWGNRYRIYEPDSQRFGRITLGFPYVEFDVPVGSAHGIAAFYDGILDAPAGVANGDAVAARVSIGKDQKLVFRETERPLPDFDEHHIAIYVVNFSGPHGRLKARNLVNREDNQYQWRFRDIVDPDTNRVLFTIEHEVRSVTHPMFLRPLVNRNAAQTNRNYAMGYDETHWMMEPTHYDD